ncbi:MAG TPA: hypothetical protein VEI54_09830 [Candidatus Limnocylindrales bacterium]|nr:hypothetical protein [Candidatus Limnocylindrales bacterium]
MASKKDQSRAGSAASASSTTPRLVWLFAFTMFLSAFLLFQVQLIISKHILPWFGGSAAVWTTNMLVFQILLLGGYVYSHFISEQLPVPAQGHLHLTLLGIALLLVLVLSFLWPSAITPGPAWKPADSQHPVRDVILITLLATGLPFFVLSTTGPLLQNWFARQGGDVRTYRFYSVSNLGSLLGLLSFPFLVEPVIRLKVQGTLWSTLFALFCIACGWCAWHSVQGSERPKDTENRVDGSPEPNSVLAHTLWFLLAAGASALLLATTNQLCQEIISLPLLWVLPLALYLLSFILCFDHPRWYRREVFHPLFAIGIFGLCASMVFAQRTVQVVVMPLLLFVGCMICHGELVRLKPGVHRLTAFYLAISAGGAMGGMFVAILAPQIFRFFTEFQLSLAACAVLLLVCLFLDKTSWIYSRAFWLISVIVVGFILTVFLIGQWIPAFAGVLERTQFYPLTILFAVLLLSGAYIQSRSSVQSLSRFCVIQPAAVALALLAMVALYESAKPEPGLFLGERDFYGALRIFELAQGGKALFHAHTLHGAQLNPPKDRLPMAYYGPESGIGLFLRNHPKRTIGDGALRVGIVGLGTGTLAVYGRPGDYFRCYEINPQVVDLSRGPHPVFTYLRDSAAKVDTELGDARLLLEQEAAQGNVQRFDVLVLDAFSGDAVPVHLLTREAFDTYAKHLRDDNAVIAMHLSSRHINLLPVLEGVREYQHAYSLVNFSEGSYPFIESLWVFLAKRPEALQVPGLFSNPPPFMPPAAPRLWTDDYSDIFRLIY